MGLLLDFVPLQFSGKQLFLHPSALFHQIKSGKTNKKRKKILQMM